MTWENPIALRKRLQAEQQPAMQAIPVTVGNVEHKSLTLAHYQTAMSVDLAKLSAIKVMEEKQRVKRLLLKTYRDFVRDYVEQQHNYPNSVAVQVMVWLFDVGEIEQALPLAFYLYPHQSMPERFARRDIQTFICDALYDYNVEKNSIENNATFKVFFDAVIAEMEKEKWVLSPPVASKTYVKTAKLHYFEYEYKTAVELLEKAKAVNPEGWGGKTLLAQAKARL